MPLPESQTGAGNIELKKPSAGEIGAVDSNEVSNKSTVAGASLTDALDALKAASGLITTTKGDLLVRGAAVLTRLPVGIDGQVLAADSTQPLGVRWAADGPASPLTTKGDVLGFGAAPARIPVGADGEVLTADSAQALGVKWAAAVAPYVPPVTTKGDLFSFSAAPDRLPVGADGEILSADSTEGTGLKWIAAPVPATPTLADVLTAGNETSGTNIILGTDAIESVTGEASVKFSELIAGLGLFGWTADNLAGVPAVIATKKTEAGVPLAVMYSNMEDGGTAQGQFVLLPSTFAGAAPPFVAMLTEGASNIVRLFMDGSRLDAIQAQWTDTSGNVFFLLSADTLGNNFVQLGANYPINFEDSNVQIWRDTNDLKFKDVASASTYTLSDLAAGGGQTIYDAIVAAAGGTHTTLGAAVTAGAKSIYVMDGTYVEVGAITTLAETTIVGESLDAIIDLGDNLLTLEANSVMTNLSIQAKLEAGDAVLCKGGVKIEKVDFISSCVTPALTRYFFVAIDVSVENCVLRDTKYTFAQNSLYECGIKNSGLFGCVENAIFIASVGGGVNNRCVEEGGGSNVYKTIIGQDTFNSSSAIAASAGGYWTDVRNFSMQGGLKFDNCEFISLSLVSPASLKDVKATGTVIIQDRITAEDIEFSGNTSFEAAADNSQVVNGRFSTGSFSINGSCDNLKFANCIIFPNASFLISSDNHMFTNCEIKQEIEVSGNHNTFVGTRFPIAGNVTVSGDQNTISSSRVGVDAGGGTSTISVTAAANDTIIIGTRTDDTITDAGTGTTVAANVVY